jgi:hypothetical protein
MIDYDIISGDGKTHETYSDKRYESKGYEIKSIEDAERIINVQHRQLCKDIESINDLRQRVLILEQPWWKRRKYRWHANLWTD